MTVSLLQKLMNSLLNLMRTKSVLCHCLVKWMSSTEALHVSQRPWSKIQCQMILTFLSFADYFRPSYLLLENVRAFVSYSKVHMFRLTLVSLLEMGYQLVRTSSSYKPCLSFKKACFSTWSSTRRGSSGRFVGLRDVGERVEEERNVEWLGIR
ncbi:unnamed protein product [Eruca vesicaria subsp. sativa]|uniref:Uncharacterized protein n=1 Tax=Eruca vesicaria subsp. sativa TaxID=29727 RepID=A0ABC8LLZ9_ERUVS|nr:unnamed protein product [Eruca vesicaria subsp. sativa]